MCSPFYIGIKNWLAVCRVAVSEEDIRLFQFIQEETQNVFRSIYGRNNREAKFYSKLNFRENKTEFDHLINKANHMHRYYFALIYSNSAGHLPKCTSYLILR